MFCGNKHGINKANVVDANQFQEGTFGLCAIIRNEVKYLQLRHEG
jgi:hypothetical protein